MEAMRFADDRVRRHAYAAADLGSRMAFGPKRPEFLNVVVGPVHRALLLGISAQTPPRPSAGGAPGKGADGRPARPLRGVPAG
jgi:hypothetical protein